VTQRRPFSLFLKGVAQFINYGWDLLVVSEGDSASWVKHGNNGDRSKAAAPSTLQRQGSVRMRVKSFDAMSGDL
jgi:hypothetical protein